MDFAKRRPLVTLAKEASVEQQEWAPDWSGSKKYGREELETPAAAVLLSFAANRNVVICCLVAPSDLVSWYSNSYVVPFLGSRLSLWWALTKIMWQKPPHASSRPQPSEGPAAFSLLEPMYHAEWNPSHTAGCGEEKRRRWAQQAHGLHQPLAPWHPHPVEPPEGYSPRWCHMNHNNHPINSPNKRDNKMVVIWKPLSLGVNFYTAFSNPNRETWRGS